MANCIYVSNFRPNLLSRQANLAATAQSQLLRTISGPDSVLTPSGRLMQNCFYFESDRSLMVELFSYQTAFQCPSLDLVSRYEHLFILRSQKSGRVYKCLLGVSVTKLRQNHSFLF